MKYYSVLILSLFCVGTVISTVTDSPDDDCGSCTNPNSPKSDNGITIDLSYLVSLAESEKDKQLAVQMFQHFYSDKLFKVLDGQIKDNNKTLNFDNVQKMFQHFGHSISKLVVEFVDEDFYHGRAAELGESVNLYSAESLMHFELLQTGKGFYFLESMTKPFVRVENVTVYGRMPTLKSKTLNFNELFPAMKRMDMFNLGKIIDTNGIDSEFPHLEYAAIWIRKQFSELVKGFTDVDVENFVRKNAQLRSFKLEFVDREILKLVLRLLPELKNLELSGSTGNIKVDDFKHLAPETLNLDELSLILSDSVSNEMIIEFINKSVTIKKLHFEIKTTEKTIFTNFVENLQKLYKEKWTIVSTSTELYPFCFRNHLYLEQVPVKPNPEN